MRNVLFVCAGNTCRSPLCEALGNKLLPSFSFSSRALSGFSGDDASEGSKNAAARHSLDLSKHKSKALTLEDIEAADEIICMTNEQRGILSALLGRFSIKKDIAVLGRGIPDPYMGDSEIYENCYNEIKAALISHFFGVSVSEMTKDDIPSIYPIETASFSTPWTKEGFSEFLENENNFGFTLKKDGEVVGYITGSCVLGEAEIYNVAVREDEKRKGFGRLLLLEFLDRTSAENTVLEVRKSNMAAITLYEKLGFKPIGERKNFYLNPREDALIYKKER